MNYYIQQKAASEIIIYHLIIWIAANDPHNVINVDIPTGWWKKSVALFWKLYTKNTGTQYSRILFYYSCFVRFYLLFRILYFLYVSTVSANLTHLPLFWCKFLLFNVNFYLFDDISFLINATFYAVCILIRAKHAEDQEEQHERRMEGTWSF